MQDYIVINFDRDLIVGSYPRLNTAREAAIEEAQDNPERSEEIFICKPMEYITMKFDLEKVKEDNDE